MDNFLYFLDSTLYTFDINKREFNQKELKIVSESATLEYIDYAFHNHIGNSPLGSLLLVEVPLHLFDKGNKIAIGQFRSAFFAKGTPLCDVIKVVRNAVLGENLINTMTSLKYM